MEKVTKNFTNVLAAISYGPLLVCVSVICQYCVKMLNLGQFQKRNKVE